MDRWIERWLGGYKRHFDVCLTKVSGAFPDLLAYLIDHYMPLT